MAGRPQTRPPYGRTHTHTLSFTRRFGHINATAPCVSHARPHTRPQTRTCMHEDYTDARQQAAVPSHVEPETSHGQPVHDRQTDIRIIMAPPGGQERLVHSRNLTRLANPPNVVMSNCPPYDVTTYICTYLHSGPVWASYPPRCTPRSLRADLSRPLAATLCVLFGC